MSTLGELSRTFFFCDETCTQFLKDCELLPNTKLCIKLNSVGEQQCEMKETLKKIENVIFTRCLS